MPTATPATFETFQGILAQAVAHRSDVDGTVPGPQMRRVLATFRNLEADDQRAADSFVVERMKDLILKLDLVPARSYVLIHNRIREAMQEY